MAVNIGPQAPHRRTCVSSMPPLALARDVIAPYKTVDQLLGNIARHYPEALDGEDGRLVADLDVFWNGYVQTAQWVLGSWKHELEALAAAASCSRYSRRRVAAFLVQWITDRLEEAKA